MLATALRGPLNAARRTTTLSLKAVGQLTAAAFPQLAMPTDSIALRAWATGLSDDEPDTVPHAS